MNIGLMYYLGGVSENIGIALGLIGFAALLIGAVTALVFNIDVCPSNDEESNRFKKIFKKVIIFSSISILLFTILPNRKETVAMYVVPKIENNEKVCTITDKLMDRIIEILKEDDDKNAIEK